MLNFPELSLDEWIARELSSRFLERRKELGREFKQDSFLAFHAHGNFPILVSAR